MQIHKKEIRRQDKAVNNVGWMNDILKRGQLLSLAMVDTDGSPYMTTVSYGYEKEKIYLHGIDEGKKFNALTINPHVCFQVVVDAELAKNDIPCKCSWKYRSVTGFGKIRTLSTLEEKNKALALIVRQYNGTYKELPQIPESLWITCIEIEHLTGKSSIYPITKFSCD